MDTFLVDYTVTRRREVSGRTKEGKDWKRIEYRGTLSDAFGHTFECDAQQAFGGSESVSVHDGDTVSLVVSELSFSSAFPLVKFRDVVSRAAGKSTR